MGPRLRRCARAMAAAPVGLSLGTLLDASRLEDVYLATLDDLEPSALLAEDRKQAPGFELAACAGLEQPLADFVAGLGKRGRGMTIRCLR